MNNGSNFDQAVDVRNEMTDDVSLELFAEELSDQADLVGTNFCTAGTFGSVSSFSSASSCGASVSSGSSFSSGC